MDAQKQILSLFILLCSVIVTHAQNDVATGTVIDEQDNPFID